jgi:putative oxidoreductase
MTSSASSALRALRIVVATLLLIHGSTRLLSGGVPGFGVALTEKRIPFGPALAWTITALEILGTLAMAAGFMVRPLALYFAAELAMGILLVHRHFGWFVVGGGQNGMEYSVLLISVFLALAWAGDKDGKD